MVFYAKYLWECFSHHQLTLHNITVPSTTTSALTMRNCLDVVGNYATWFSTTIWIMFLRYPLLGNRCISSRYYNLKMFGIVWLSSNTFYLFSIFDSLVLLNFFAMWVYVFANSHDLLFLPGTICPRKNMHISYLIC